MGRDRELPEQSRKGTPDLTIMESQRLASLKLTTDMYVDLKNQKQYKDLNLEASTESEEFEEAEAALESLNSHNSPAPEESDHTATTAEEFVIAWDTTSGYEDADDADDGKQRFLVGSIWSNMNKIRAHWDKAINPPNSERLRALGYGFLEIYKLKEKCEKCKSDELDDYFVNVAEIDDSCACDYVPSFIK